ncbi:hypothetical protein OROGR_000537 [Orobanche gracilis]
MKKSSIVSIFLFAIFFISGMQILQRSEAQTLECLKDQDCANKASCPNPKCVCKCNEENVARPENIPYCRFKSCSVPHCDNPSCSCEC